MLNLQTVLRSGKFDEGIKKNLGEEAFNAYKECTDLMDGMENIVHDLAQVYKPYEEEEETRIEVETYPYSEMEDFNLKQAILKMADNGYGDCNPFYSLNSDDIANTLYNNFDINEVNQLAEITSIDEIAEVISDKMEIEYMDYIEAAIRANFLDNNTVEIEEI